MARPLRFRVSPGTWSDERVRSTLLAPLQENIGATLAEPRYRPAGDWTAQRFEMDNGDVALFAWDDEAGYWVGNTETPAELWRTEKYGWGEVPYGVARWVQRELLADLHEESPWLADYPHLSWFFLPVFMSKDGRETTRRFFRDHAAGFPDADRETALGFFESFLRTGTLDSYRETMAGKLGTSNRLDLTRMRSTMAEFTAAKILFDAGYDPVPEIEVDTGHRLDYQADGTLVEVTRPQPPANRPIGTAVEAVRETAGKKADGQLDGRGGALLLVDCSSFPDDRWAAVLGERPTVRAPALVYRAHPPDRIEGYAVGDLPLNLADAVSLRERTP